MNIDKLTTDEHSIIYENYFCTPKPVPLSEARINKCIDKGIEDHIIICGIVPDIINIILPLRPKLLRGME